MSVEAAQSSSVSSFLRRSKSPRSTRRISRSWVSVPSVPIWASLPTSFVVTLMGSPPVQNEAIVRPASSSKQAQTLQFGRHFRRHVAGVAPGPVGGYAISLEIAPALERPAGLRRGRNDGALDLDSAVFPGLFLVEILVEPDQYLAAADDTAHHPIERPAIQQLLRALGRVSGVDPVGRAGLLAPLFPSGGLNLLHMREVVDPDGELDHVESHGRQYRRRGLRATGVDYSQHPCPAPQSLHNCGRRVVREPMRGEFD